MGHLALVRNDSKSSFLSKTSPSALGAAAAWGREVGNEEMDSSEGKEWGRGGKEAGKEVREPVN